MTAQATMRTTFQLFAKAPIDGHVKTRLCPPLSPSGAARLYVRMLERTADQMARAVASVDDARGELWCAPDDRDPTLRAIAAHHGFALRVQSTGTGGAPPDLGERMRTALSSALPGCAILVGSDIPALDAARLVAARVALAAADAVFIPADDGGYVLVGCRDCVPDCFDGIAWSTAAVMRDTRARLAAAGTRWTELPAMWDVDDAGSLARLAREPALSALLEGIETGGGKPAYTA